jgi:hypothetical protein
VGDSEVDQARFFGAGQNFNGEAQGRAHALHEIGGLDCAPEGLCTNGTDRRDGQALEPLPKALQASQGAF